MNAFEVSDEEYKRYSVLLAQAASELDRPNKRDQKARSRAISFGEKYFTTPGTVTKVDLAQIREFLVDHGYNPDAPRPNVTAPVDTHKQDESWISVSQQLPTIPEKANEIKVEIKYLVEDDVAQVPALFVSDQFSANPMGFACFVLQGKVLDRLNQDGGPAATFLYVEPTHWRLRDK
ncbi:hypothetical protein [Burkholderia gladioli]|uniref:hypothetical protein n=1 Tax=Burkholderia gladioli TaxID=28095 RepID=UPI00163FDE36|nr:hypothetical protein [Burkholderia gladioli]